MQKLNCFSAERPSLQLQIAVVDKNEALSSVTSKLLSESTEYTSSTRVSITFPTTLERRLVERRSAPARLKHGVACKSVWRRDELLREPHDNASNSGQPPTYPGQFYLNGQYMASTGQFRGFDMFYDRLGGFTRCSYDEFTYLPVVWFCGTTALLADRVTVLSVRLLVFVRMMNAHVMCSSYRN